MKIKKIMSVVLSVCMAATMIPASLSVGAEEAETPSKDNVEITFTSKPTCTKDSKTNSFKSEFDGTWSGTHIISADSLAYLKSGSAAMNNIAACVKVTGTVAQPFDLNLLYSASTYAFWDPNNSSNKKMTGEYVNVTKPGIYYVSMQFTETANPSVLEDIGIVGSKNSFTNNPDAVVTVEEMYINASDTFKINDYTSSVYAQYTGPFRNVWYPKEVNGLTITRTSFGKEIDKSRITSVYLPDGTDVGTQKFYKHFTNLETVRLPSDLKTIGDSAFCGCTSLKTIEIPDGVTEIRSFAFENTGLTSIEIPDSVTKLGVFPGDTDIDYGYVFKNCVDLKTVKLPSGITKICNDNFYGCTSLQEITIPDSVTEIEGFAFKNCESLKTLNLPANGVEIKSSAFENCKSLTSVNGIAPNSTIYQGAFDKCTSLESVVIPDGVFIKQAAFLNTGLKEVVLPNTLSRPLEDYAFGYYQEFDENGELVEDENGHVIFNKVDGFIVRMNLEDVTETGGDQIKLTTTVNGYDYAKTNGFIIVDEYQNKLLKAAITLAETYTNDGTYTDKSFEDFQKALEEAKAVPENASRADVYESRMKLKNAEENLVGKEDLFADLQTVIKEAEAKDAKKYSKKSYDVLTAAIKAAKLITTDSSFEEIKAAKAAIQTAIEGLVAPADYTAVDKAIAKIPADLSKYTDASVKALNNAKNAVNRTLGTDEQAIVDGYAKAINDAIAKLVKKPTSKTTKATRSKKAVQKDKAAAKKAMKQAKISKLKVKSKAKKKINVTWKKVKKAKGYQVQVSTNKKFKKSKIIFKKDLKKTKLTIKNKKIKSKKTYYVRVRAYATYKNTNNKTVKVYSKWNKKLRKVKVK